MNNRNFSLYTIQKTQNHDGAIQPYIVYWVTNNLKDVYAPYKIVITIFNSVEFGTVLLLSANIEQCQIQNFHFSRYLIGGGNVL